MIKKIKTSSIQLGMYIHAFGEGSDSINFKKPAFLLERESTRLRLLASNIRFILIDTEKGCDGGVEMIEEKARRTALSLPQILKFKGKTSVEEETPVAKEIIKQAHVTLNSVMNNIRTGKSLEIEALEPLAEKIMASVIRNNCALISLAHIKNKDDYTFMHSVSVAGLLSILAMANNMDEESIYEVALGGLLHDLGKVSIPNDILNKPGELTEQERIVMRNHVRYSEKLLENKFKLSCNTLDVVTLHHEKIDGTGYPYGLTGSQLSDAAKMSAIVDIYDAITSARIYKTRWEPAFALKKMIEWSENQLDKTLLFKFIHCLGVYPVGSFVEMESGRVGMVVDQNKSDITKPFVKFFYNRKTEHTGIELVDLSLEKIDRILTPISPDKYGIDVSSIRC